MLSFKTRANSELLKALDLRGALITMLVGFVAAFALLTLTSCGLRSPSPDGHSGLAPSPETRTTALIAESFDYFPSGYENRAQDIEPQPATF